MVDPSSLLPALGHVDKNKDNSCDRCGKLLKITFKNFRCDECDEYEVKKDLPRVGCFYRVMHFFIHFFCWLRFIFRL